MNVNNLTLQYRLLRDLNVWTGYGKLIWGVLKSTCSIENATEIGLIYLLVMFSIQKLLVSWTTSFKKLDLKLNPGLVKKLDLNPGLGEL